MLAISIVLHVDHGAFVLFARVIVTLFRPQSERAVLQKIRRKTPKKLVENNFDGNKVKEKMKEK